MNDKNLTKGLGCGSMSEVLVVHACTPSLALQRQYQKLGTVYTSGGTDRQADPGVWEPGNVAEMVSIG